MRNPSGRDLARRDLALASVMGIVGGESDFGGSGRGLQPFGGDFGGDFGDEHEPVQVAKAVAFYKKAAAEHHYGQQRARMLNPNEGSNVKIERYAFNLSTALTLGVVVTLNITGQPDYEIRPQRVIMNAPAPGFVVINELKVANVSVTSGGSEDAFGYSAQAQGSELDMPTLTPANRATILGGYTGFVPPGYVGGNAFLFSASFRGPSNLAG